MCGIVAGFKEAEVARGLAASRHRGPDASGVRDVAGVWLGHARLAILDLDRRSDQPLSVGLTTVSYNGELWNYRSLREELELDGVAFVTSGDTEVIAAALDRWGIAALLRFDGMFAMAWTVGDGLLRLTRDRFGEIPLHYTRCTSASELKVLAEMSPETAREAAYVPPGCVVTLAEDKDPAIEMWHSNGPLEPSPDGFEAAAARVSQLLSRGVLDRTIADVPVCTLLSGGLDSSIIAKVATAAMPGLVAYTAVYDPRSADLVASRRVAGVLGIELREVPIQAPTRADLARTVTAIEQPHKAQVEIGWPCLALAERVRSDGFKVVFSGEGSDELWGSYGFSYHGIKAHGFSAYRRRLFLEQHRKNFARCNKAFMTAGVECRLPFLHAPLVDYAWSLTRDAVRRRNRPKAVLEEAFRADLPREVVDRRKVAFQDGLGIKGAAAAAVDGPPATFYRDEYARRYHAVDVTRDVQQLLF